MSFLFPFTPSHQARTVVDVAVADGRFKTLVSALQNTGLVSTLQGKGPFTVFAPTDDAFRMLNLNGVSASALKNILLYHVVAGYFTSDNLKSVLALKSVQGSPLDVTFKNGKIYINDSQVIISDIVTSNGIIHVIDFVLQPHMTTGYHSM
jgi:transforming growth factor-beta-induced protein